MDIEDVKERLKREAEWSTPPISKIGQKVGISRGPITLSSEEAGFLLTIPIERSQVRTKQIAMALFDLYLDEVLR